jgi:hypothetical protein
MRAEPVSTEKEYRLASNGPVIVPFTNVLPIGLFPLIQLAATTLLFGRKVALMGRTISPSLSMWA